MCLPDNLAPDNWFKVDGLMKKRSRPRALKKNNILDVLNVPVSSLVC